MAKGPDAFRTISEAADEVGVAQHVLRFWETRFSFIRPMKRAGGRRFYRPQDVAVLQGLKARLHDDQMSIKDVQKLYRECGIDRVLRAAPPDVTVSLTAAGSEMSVPDLKATKNALGSGSISPESQMRLRLSLAGLTATKQRLDDLLNQEST